MAGARLDNLPGDLLRRQPLGGEHIDPFPLLEELLRQPERPHRRADAGRAQVTRNCVADTAGNPAVLDGDDEAVRRSQRAKARVYGQNPSWIDDGDTDALR